jgi:hypothetical protein
MLAATVCVAAGIHVAQKPSASGAPLALPSLAESQVVHTPLPAQIVTPLPPPRALSDPSGSIDVHVAVSPEAAPPPTDAGTAVAASASATTTVAAVAEESSPSRALAPPATRAPVVGKDPQPNAPAVHNAIPARTAPHAAIARDAPF